MGEISATPRVRILGLRVARRAQEGNSLPGLVATFDVEIPLMTMFGASVDVVPPLATD